MFGKKQQEQREKIIAYKRTFGTPEGKTVLFDLMNKYHVLNGHKGDIHKEGERSVVLGIMYMCNINMEEFDRLMKGEGA